MADLSTIAGPRLNRPKRTIVGRHGRRFVWVAFALIVAYPSAAARAQQPFFTDDADVTARGRFHFEFSNEFDTLQRAAYPNLRQNTASFELNYGLWRNLEIGVEAPLITIVNARDPSVAERIVTGIGDTNFSAKYNFRREREGSKLPAMTVTFNLEVPTGDVNRQLGSGLADYALNSVFQKSLGAKTALRANGGIIFSGNTVTGAIGIRTRGTVLTGGASLVRRFAPRLYLGAEVAGAFARNLDLSKGQIQTQVGGNYMLRENLSLDFGVIAGRDASPRLGAQIGISLDF